MGRFVFKDGCKAFKGREFVCVKAGEWRGGGGILQGMDEVAGSVCRGVGGAGAWHGHMGGEPFEGIGVAFGVCGRDERAIAAVVLCRMADVPAVFTMRGPGFADGWFLVYNDFGAEGAEWCAVEIEGTVELGVGREARVDARGAEQVER